MSVQTSTPGARDYENALIEADRAAPTYTFKTNWVLLALVLALYCACFAPIFTPVPFGWAVIFLGPIFLLAGVVALFVRTSQRLGRGYADQWVAESGAKYRARNLNVAALGSDLWTRNQRMPARMGIVYLILVALSIGAHFWHEFGDVVLSRLVTLQAWLFFLGRIGLFLLGGVIFVFCAASALLCVRYEKISLADLRGPRRELDEVDSNTLEVIQYDIGLKTMLRRVDTYTLESTLLGALAFSAFVQILVDSARPIGDLAWITSFAVETRTAVVFDRVITFPMIPNLMEVSKGHLGSAIAVFLLSATVSFLAVLAARIQFTDAFRNAENLHAMATKFNEKAESLAKESSERAEAFNRQVDTLLLELEVAIKRVTPILDFMRIFRDWGLWLFLTATAICGLGYSIYAMAFIVFIFISSAIFFALYKMITIEPGSKRSGALNWLLKPAMHERAPTAPPAADTVSP